MSSSNAQPLFVEFTKHALLVARATGTEIEAFRECSLDNKAAVEELLTSFQADWKTAGFEAITAFAPLPSRWHLATPAEAAKHRTGDALVKFAASLQPPLEEPLALVACQAADGLPVAPTGAAPWLLGFASAESLAATTAVAAEWQLRPTRTESATLNHLGAIAAALRHAGKGSVALWDLSSDQSRLFLISPAGVEAVSTCTAGLDEIFTAAQTVIGLKFRAAAARLFFNDTYDFSEIGSQIAARLAPAFQAACASFPKGAGAPALACAGFTSRQSWFVQQMATIAGLQPWAPDTTQIAAQFKLRLAPSLDTALPSTALGVLTLIASRAHSNSAWHPIWSSSPEGQTVPIAAPLAATPAPTPEPFAKPAPAPTPDPKPAPAPAAPVVVAPVAQPAPAKVAQITPSPIVLPSAAPKAPVPPAKPAPTPTPAPSAASNGKAKPQPASTPTPAPAKPSQKNQPKPVPVAAAAPAAAPEAPAKPEPKPTSSSVAYGPENAEKSRPAGNRKGLYIGIAALLLIGLFGTWKYFDHAQEFKTAEIAAAAKKADDEARARELAAKAKAEAEAARLQKLADDAREAALALARQQAEAQAKQQQESALAAELIAKAPGIVVVTSSPSGASVSIDGGPSRLTPLAASGILPGAHTLVITMAGRDPVERSFEIKGSQTTDLGLIALESSLGSLTITSEPAGANYSLQPTINVLGAIARTGTTPATLNDVSPGNYKVTLGRPGWRDQVENAAVNKRADTKVSATFNPATVKLTSVPTGATVKLDGNTLGITPLTLTENTPRSVRYLFSLQEHDATGVEGEIVGGQPLALEAKMLRTDRIAKTSEIKRAPKPISQVPPQVSYEQRQVNANAVIRLTVNRDGKIRDAKVVEATTPEVGLACLAAVAKWKFEPAVGFEDQPLNSSVSVPFRFTIRDP